MKSGVDPNNPREIWNMVNRNPVPLPHDDEMYDGTTDEALQQPFLSLHVSRFLVVAFAVNGFH